MLKVEIENKKIHETGRTPHKANCKRNYEIQFSNNLIENMYLIKK
jgi:hypothetical protein